MSPSFDGLRRICRQAVADGVVPGLTVAVGVAGRTAFLEAFGWRQREGDALEAPPDTVWDLASLTKPLVTSVLAMQAVSAGSLSLEEPLVEGRPATVRQALAHAGGFPAHRPYWQEGPDRRAIIGRAAAEPLLYEPGTRSLYSDLGFILLGDRLEQALGAPLDALAARKIFAPLGLAGIGFGGSRLDARPVAATERCPVRGRVLVGEVHDLNAWAMGGVAGHAGVFGPAADVAAVAHALCAAYRGPAALVEREILREFWRPAGVPGSTWRLGWDGPSAHGSLAGDRIDRGAVGHLAFTGCSLWLDPERETFVIVLSNRVHPTVHDDPRFRALRPALNDAALEAVGYR